MPTSPSNILPPETSTSVTPLSVTELTARIKQVLESGFSHIQVCGEISRLTRPSSGHLYFTVKDAHAAISAVVWRSTASRLTLKPEEGGEYIFSGHLSLYEPRGTYQLVITRIEAVGAGQLAAEFERRKQRFAEMGWFDAEKKKPLPGLPQHIGIVTSATAAAFEDVKKVLATRPGWLKLTLSPALVQGSSAPATIARAIGRLMEMNHPPDVILLVRGGGSIEDLWCFNDETVVRAIACATIPVISGIGHEIDTTLADFAADFRAATPSNAAECVCPSKDELRSRLPRQQSLQQLLSRQLMQLKREQQSYDQRLDYSIHRQMDARLHTSSRLLARLQQSAMQSIRQRRQPLRLIEKRLHPLQPDQRLASQRRLWLNLNHGLRLLRRDIMLSMGSRWQQQAQRLQQLSTHLTAERRKQLAICNGELRSLDPGAVLKRGYTLTLDDQGNLITTSKQLKPGQPLRVRFSDGEACTQIESIQGVTS